MKQPVNEELLILMGTIHRFPDQWLIVGFVYPPNGIGFGSLRYNDLHASPKSGY